MHHSLMPPQAQCLTVDIAARGAVAATVAMAVAGTMTTEGNIQIGFHLVLLPPQREMLMHYSLFCFAALTLHYLHLQHTMSYHWYHHSIG